MRYPYIKTICFIISLFVLGFSSCKKNVAGPKGDKGEAAKKGNAKQSQRQFTVQSSSWTTNGGWWSANVYCPEITTDVIAQGEVKVYMKIGTEWWALPYAVGDTFMHQSIESNYIHLEYSKIHGGPPPKPLETTFRVVVYTP
jgi:hypothetical protein